MHSPRFFFALALATVPSIVPACVCGSNDATPAAVAQPAAQPAAQPPSTAPRVIRAMKPVAPIKQFRVLGRGDAAPSDDDAPDAE